VSGARRAAGARRRRRRATGGSYRSSSSSASTWAGNEGGECFPSGKPEREEEKATAKEG